MQVKTKDTITVVRDGRTSRAELTAIRANGVVDAKLEDGTTVTSVQHASSGVGNHWYSQNRAEKMSANQSDPKVIAFD